MADPASDVRLHELSPEPADLRAEVLAGLTASPKSLPCKLLYDEEGSRLFDEICELEEYYPTRTEMAILGDNADELGRLLGPECLLVELGSGASVKTRIVLEHLERPVGYVPIDISRDHLLTAARAIAEIHSGLEVIAVHADYTEPVELPATRRQPRRRVVFFPGSTIGNFERDQVGDFLARIARLAGPGGGLLIGVDLRKPAAVLEPAYDDARGVTAAFNRNILVYLNRELGADFAVDRFDHRAYWDAALGCIVMQLVSQQACEVRIGDVSIAFDKGEAITTEHSHKYSVREFADLARGAGFQLERTWLDPGELFSLHWLTVG